MIVGCLKIKRVDVKVIVRSKKQKPKQMKNPIIESRLQQLKEMKQSLLKKRKPNVETD